MVYGGRVIDLRIGLSQNVVRQSRRHQRLYGIHQRRYCGSVCP